MQRDFTLKTYRRLLESLLGKGYKFVTYAEYAASLQSAVYSPQENFENSSLVTSHSSLCILRHDVDNLPKNSLATARLENELGIKGTYYFRIVPESFDERIIKEIASLGHEVGYHYEEIDTVYRQVKSKKRKVKSNEILCQAQNYNKIIEQMNNEKLKIDTSTTLRITKTTDNQPPTSVIDLAYEMFKKNLEKIRSIAPVTTICMHGSPLSPFDNKIIWSKYKYKELGLIGEPYFDIDWSEFGYLTDTGRRWDGSDVSVRDKVGTQDKKSKEKDKSIVHWSMFKDQLKSTQDIIKAIQENKLPDKIMITVHPQRWTDNYLVWGKELVLQNVKNQVKKLIVKRQM